MYQPTAALRKLLNLSKRLRGVQGGTSASKTISILQILIDKCQRDEKPTLTSVTSESMPHLRRGAMRDFKDIMQSHKYWVDDRWNKTDSIYTFETNSKMEFFSLDMPRKVRGPRRQRLFINEANNIPYETFDQLEIRTEDEIWLDWNPVSEFWWHEIVSKRDDAEPIILTYKDNEGLPESIISSIESHKNNKNWWRVYGEGLIGEIEGRVYTDWQIIDDIPHEARLERYGLDFGYTNDPAACIGVYKYNGGIVLDEEFYRKGMSNKAIADYILSLKQALVVADSAEPKSIDELRLYGLTVIGARKGKGSNSNGIARVQDQRISVTKRSVNLIKEYRSYMFQTDNSGKFINEPEGGADHCFVGSTKIKTINGEKNISEIKIGDLVLTSSGYKPVLIRWDNGQRPVNSYCLHTDTINIQLTCTNNHKIKTGEIWTKISQLQSGQMVYLNNPIKTKNIISTQEKDISQDIIGECTLMSGKALTVKPQKDFIYTIKMIINGIIRSTILNVLKNIITYQNILRKGLKITQSGLGSFMLRELSLLKPGTSQKKVQSGTSNMELMDGRIGLIKNLYAKYVEINIQVDTLESQNTAIQTATLKHLEIGESTIEKVYDLTVKDCHEYFANGILVHNCMDAVKYAVVNLVPDQEPIRHQFSGQNILDQLLNEEY